MKYVFNAGEELARLGLSNEFLVGKSIHEVLPADVATRVEAQYKRVLAGETVRFEGGYGNEFFSLTSAPLRNVKGEIANILTLSVNITERKQAEDKLKESEENYRLIFESTGTATVIVDEHTTILQANNECRRVTGYSPKELVGTSWTGYFYKEDLHKMLENAEVRIKKPSLVSSRYEVRLIKANGEIRNTIISIAYLPESKRRIASMIDITERKMAEEKVKESEETYRNLFQNAQVGIYRTRIEDGKILESNEQMAIMFGYKNRNEFINEYKTSENYVDPGTREKMLEIITEKGEINNYEARFYRKDRSIFWANYSARVYPEKDWIEGVVEDITERKQAEEELNKYSEHLEELVKERTAELEKKNNDLEHYNSLFEGREFRIKELRDQVKELKAKLEK